MSLARIVCAVAMAASFSVPPVAAAGPEYADFVAYAAANVPNSYSFELTCDADSVRTWIFAQGEEIRTQTSTYMVPVVFVAGRRSDEGRTIHVGDQVVYQDAPRREQLAAPGKGFGIRGHVSLGGAAPIPVHFAWAWWGSDAACSLEVDGHEIPITRLPGAYARYVGPQAFSGGVFAQDGGMQASAVRVYVAALSGGPVFARLISGGLAQGAIVSDGYPPVKTCGECSFAAPTASSLIASVNGVETDGGAHAQLWMIDIPPGL